MCDTYTFELANYHSYVLGVKCKENYLSCLLTAGGGKCEYKDYQAAPGRQLPLRTLIPTVSLTVHNYINYIYHYGDNSQW